MYDIAALYEVGSVAEAVALRLAHPSAQIIAGGSDVLVQVREGRRAGKELISLYGIDALRGVSLDADGTLRIGSLTSFSHITRHPLIQRYCAVLGEAVDQVGSPQIRNIGTIGGNTCNGVTSADSASTLFAWDALVELTGKNGVRRVSIADFYLGPGKVDIRAEDGEIETAVLIPRESYENTYGCYQKYGMRNAMEIATLGCSVNVRLTQDGGGGWTIDRCRTAYGVAGPVPLRCPTAEAAVKGKSCTEGDTEALAEAFASAALTDIRPRDSWRASKVFREQVAYEFARRGLTEAVRRARAAMEKGGQSARTEAQSAQSARTEAGEELNSVPDSAQNTPAPPSLPDSPAYKLVHFRLNGKAVEKMADVRSSLTDLLRLSCHCTSVKKGCEVGECGACTVLIDGEAFNSCIYLAVWAEGKDVRTLEGLLGADGDLNDLQKAFVEETAIQCGFCTPGFLMTASEILDARTLYTDDQLRRLLSGHLCRCTGYENILRAVRKAMYRNLGLEPPDSGP